jgi:hypothetical protein
MLRVCVGMCDPSPQRRSRRLDPPHHGKKCDCDTAFLQRRNSEAVQNAEKIINRWHYFSYYIGYKLGILER